MKTGIYNLFDAIRAGEFIPLSQRTLYCVFGEVYNWGEFFAFAFFIPVFLFVLVLMLMPIFGTYIIDILIGIKEDSD